ncbi:MAG: hypothetical protein HY820_05065 [Acidobacteria bacterium]|nr:hypothetical protein [Acidobacteriota bacterium]
MYLAILSLAAVLSAGTTGVTADDLDAAFKSIQKLNPQTDIAQVKAQATKLFTMAKQLASEPAPTEEGLEKSNHAKRMVWIKEVEQYTEYVVSAAATQAPQAAHIELVGMLELQNPKSKYLDALYTRYLYSLHQAGQGAKIPAIAEKAVANFPENEDLLLIMADHTFTRKQTAQALNYARRLTAVMSKHPCPEGYKPADWEKKRSAALGRGYWISGVIVGERNQYIEADQDLRRALPLIAGNSVMMESAYYYLGLSNYQLGKMTMNKAQVLEGAKFSDQAARLGGPLSVNASHNAQVMRTEASRMR